MRESRVSPAEAFARLRAVNPVTSLPQPPQLQLSEALEPVAGKSPFGHGKARWLKPVIAFALLAAVFFAVAPALGLHLPPLDFWSAEKAPPKVMHEFDEMGVGAPPGMDPGVIPGETRLIEKTVLAGKLQELWVGPTKTGGYCVMWSNFPGGCEKLGTVPLEVFGILESNQKLSGDKSQPFVWPTSGKQIAFAGYVKSTWVDSVELRFADGTILHPDILWVSAPINVGFFTYTPTPERQERAHELRSVVALDAHGNVVTSRDETPRWEQRPGRPLATAPPADALTGEKRVLIEADTADGPAVLYVAPTRYEGRCHWIELAGRFHHGYCEAKGMIENESGIGFGFLPTSKAVLLTGNVDDRVESVELRFADGDSEAVQVHENLVLASIPPEHLKIGHEASEVIARDASGKVLMDEKLLMDGKVPRNVKDKLGFWTGCWGVLPVPEAVAATCR